MYVLRAGKVGLVSLLVSCGKVPAKQPSTESQIAVLADQVSQLSPKVCTKGEVSWACKDDQDGDVLVWNGLLSLSGEKKFCSALKMSVDESGRPWRGPYFYKNDTVNEFSRDSLIGLSAWVVGCDDKATWQRFKSFRDNHVALCEHPTDNKCDLTNNTRDLIKHIDRHFGIANGENLTGYSESLLISARFNSTGYPMNLVATQIYILNKTGTNNTTLDLAKAKLRERQPNNPFFNYLSGNEQSAVNIAIQRVRVAGKTNQWSFERDDSESAWVDSMGWEWLFLYNLVK